MYADESGDAGHAYGTESPDAPSVRGNGSRGARGGTEKDLLRLSVRSVNSGSGLRFCDPCDAKAGPPSSRDPPVRATG
jgi:hypothetical protein